VSIPKVNLGPLRVSEQFGTRYTILRQLGIGGMGAVYQAWDSELNVAVALKVIRPEAAQDLEAAQDIERRFKQELLLARQVTHKNVVRIHDLGEINGIKYITMPYIEGADLATVLRDTPRLPVPKVLSIIRQIAAGLQAAHEAGVVHRDLKPANVMIDNESAIIMDFGIARSTSRVGSMPSGPTKGSPTSSGVSIDETMTQAAATVVGAVIGTIEYMAPEQARGEHVDHRVDIYAFGLILYDLLAGRRRIEHAPSAVFELQKRMGELPPPIRSIAPAVPEALEKFVTKCVEPDAAKRFQTAAEMVAALDRLDDRGKLRPIKKVIGLPYAVAAALALLALSGGIWYYTRPPVQHDPISVVIADLENRTGDPALDQTLEPMLKRALEGAGFITAYDRNGIRLLGMPPRDSLSEVAAMELAVKQGLGVVVSGSIAPQARGYTVTIKATRAVTGDLVTTDQRAAASKEQVLEAATRLITRVRSALGDDESESTQMFAMTSLSATSLEVVRYYASAMDAAASNRFEEAKQGFLKAIELDPMFGIGYQSLTNVMSNLGERQESRKYIDEALKHLDGMTERERLTTRGLFSLETGDYQQCVKEYSDMIARFAADVGAHNQLALCYSKLRELTKARDEMLQIVKILPKHILFRDNLALYSAYAGDFQAAETEARSIEGPDVYAMLALAFAQLGQGQFDQAKATYEAMSKVNALGASMAASGLGDLAVVQGRFSDAVSILEQAATADISAKSPDRAAAKFLALANANLSRTQPAVAVAAADRALQNNSAGVGVRFLAGRIYIEAGNTRKARPVIEGLARELQNEPQAYGKILEGLAALKGGDARKAVGLIAEANKQFDTWIGHLELGRAYLELKQPLQADFEFDTCLKRRGEALSLFLDEEPTLAYLPVLYYYQGRGRQVIGTQGFRESFRQYLSIRGNSSEDPLLNDVRNRMK
jgi:serine/threonine protein kinase/tetratricopeptide (TPR) repeat protein